MQISHRHLVHPTAPQEVKDEIGVLSPTCENIFDNIIVVINFRFFFFFFFFCFFLCLFFFFILCPDLVHCIDTSLARHICIVIRVQQGSIHKDT